ncbi:hypothetical protein BH10CHL1_BH10CHL1_01090 [soil metagenome]
MAETDNLTILNVDDDEIGLYTKSRILRRAGYVVLEAQTGSEALRVVREAQPQLVLLDVKLPDMSGIEVGRQIKTSLTTAQIMVLHISATYLDQGTRTRALEGGADAYISAPIEAEELLANVKALLRLWRAEATIRESEERWSLAVRTTGDAIWDWDITTGKMWWNEAYNQRFGQSPLDVDASHQWWTDHIHPDDRDRVVASFHASLEGNATAWSEEYRYQCADNTYAEIHDRASIMRNTEGVATRVLGAILDLSERKQVERQLAYHAHLLENVHDAVLATDANFLLTVWNRGAERMYGWKASEVLGRHVQSIIRSETADEQVVDSLDGLKSSGRQRTELITHHKDGALIYTESVTVALYDKGEQVTGYLSINRDISERKLYEQALKALNASLEQRVAERTTELENSNQELDRFAYIASHDLKAPLRAIDNLATWIADDVDQILPEPSRVHLKKLRGRVESMKQLLEDLLVYSRAGRYQYPSEKVDSTVLVNNILKLLNPPAPFTITVQAGMPVFWALRIPLELVLRNLIDNAIKHHDRLNGHVEISACEEDAFIEFCVADDGPGIDAAFHERIFQMFQTLRPRDQVEGSGIGLAVVKKTVESYGGAIRLDSREKQGAKFWFTWPKE